MKFIQKKVIGLCICFSCVIAVHAQNFLAVGYAGKDTLNVGTAIVDKKGTVQLRLNGYEGYVQLVPQTEAYAEMEKHFEQFVSIKNADDATIAQKYVLDSLNFALLYRSPFWRTYVQNWVTSYLVASKNADEFSVAFVPVAKQVLERVKKDPMVGSHLSKNLLEIFEQYNLEKVAAEIASYSLGLHLETPEHSEMADRVMTAAKLVGSTPPDVLAIEGKIVFGSEKVLLFFYETTCGNCHDEITQLKQKFESLKAQGVRVISISADKEKGVFESEKLPWNDKLCDLSGFDGVNFKNYGVVATPTFYVVEKGKITGRYARLIDTGILNNPYTVTK